MTWLRIEHGQDFATYRHLWQWSVDDPKAFWGAILTYFDVMMEGSTEPVMTGEHMPDVQWFANARLNYTENILRRAHDEELADVAAIHGVDETGTATKITWRQLEAQVASMAHSLRELGVQRGDRVVAVLPNIAEAIIGLLATASIGAIWSICSPDVSPTATLSRLQQLEPKVLIGTTGYSYNGKYFDRRAHLEQIERGLPTLQTTIVVDDETTLHTERKIFAELSSKNITPQYDRVPFSHPLWVLFSSGTTGEPKGIVHSQGGMLVEALKTFGLHQDLGPGDLSYVAANTSWMVWNTLLHALATGASVLVYSGSPTYQRPDQQFKLMADHGVTTFATGAAYLTLVENSGCVPKDEFDLAKLRIMRSTASPLPLTTWRWVHDAVKADVHLGSDSGGTDICSAFIGSNPLEPVRLGQLQGPVLGIDVQVWDDTGTRVIGDVGEMVITTPSPAMPVSFWNDPDGSKYRGAYFENFPGVWTHGDWITETPEGGFIVHGRSDATLNRDGVRLGSAEIYDALQHVPEVRQSLVVGVELPHGGYYQPLFVTLADDVELTPELTDRINQTIREHASVRHVPDDIHLAPDIPLTHVGKKIEVPIKRLLAGGPTTVINPQSLQNPASAEWFFDFAARLRA
jgi:acetoacetyl-CoA synthetase